MSGFFYFVTGNEIKKIEKSDLQVDTETSEMDHVIKDISLSGIFVWNSTLYGLDTDGTKMVKVDNSTDTMVY